eukprot:TRINITY_DN14957_c0_g3_i3.p1 TRINITY_DN14957_c0_g3~~TRINITY_DN14957_c0_g3_i3.p1  ORF type:complete len:324 (+),score=119.34 TRINITY_DN14957_c0_g3_i3:152-1123(+)
MHLLDGAENNEEAEETNEAESKTLTLNCKELSSIQMIVMFALSEYAAKKEITIYDMFGDAIYQQPIKVKEEKRNVEMVESADFFGIAEKIGILLDGDGREEIKSLLCIDKKYPDKIYFKKLKAIVNEFAKSEELKQMAREHYEKFEKEYKDSIIADDNEDTSNKAKELEREDADEEVKENHEINNDKAISTERIESGKDDKVHSVQEAESVKSSEKEGRQVYTEKDFNNDKSKSDSQFIKSIESRSKEMPDEIEANPEYPKEAHEIANMNDEQNESKNSKDVDNLLEFKELHESKEENKSNRQSNEIEEEYKLDFTESDKEDY